VVGCAGYVDVFGISVIDCRVLLVPGDVVLGELFNVEPGVSFSRSHASE